VVNGVKKWITNGTFADYFATAVRTGGPGRGVRGRSFAPEGGCLGSAQRVEVFVFGI